MGFTFTTIRYTMWGLQNCTILRNIDMKTFLQVKGYSRWTHRRPVRVVNEKELFEDSDERSAANNILKDAKFAFARRQKVLAYEAEKAKPKPVNENENGTLNEDGTPIYKKLQKDDALMSTLMLTVKSRKKQKRDDRILLEGHRLIEDAIKVGLVPEMIIFSRKHDLRRLSLPKEGVKLYKIPYQTIQLWSDLTTCPGIMGIFRTPDVSEREPADNSIPVTIICDNVREPGNLGSILRVAAGVGCERVILTKGCVDLWSPKVLRSASGAHFRLPIFKSQTWPEVQYLISENANIYVADNNVKPPTDLSENSDLPEADSSSSSDSDSDSESSDSEPEHDEKAKNVAKKILQDSERSSVETSKISASEKSLESKENHDSQSELDDEAKKILRTIHQDFGEKSKDAVLSESDGTVESQDSREWKQAIYEDVENLPIIPYFAAKYTNSESIVIVGGETEGLSPESLALALRRDGVRVNVPLTNGVDSLNTGTALGVVLFEIKRQFLTKLNECE